MNILPSVHRQRLTSDLAYDLCLEFQARIANDEPKIFWNSVVIFADVDAIAIFLVRQPVRGFYAGIEIPTNCLTVSLFL